MNWKRPLALLLALALAAGHFLWLRSDCPPAWTSPDANGYFAQGALIATRGTDHIEPESPLIHLGIHWLEAPNGDFYSRYPPGVGVLTAIPYRLFGPHTAVYLPPLLASLSVLLLFLLARGIVGDTAALGASVLLAIQPDLNYHALNWGAHTHVEFFLLLGLLLLVSWSRNPSKGKAFAAGLVLGVLPSLRYAEAVAGLGVGLFLCLEAWRRRGRVPDIFLALAGALIPVGLLMWRNAGAFGSPFDTGYALTGEQQYGSGFRLEFLESKWTPYLEALMGPGVGLVFAFGLGGLVLMAARKRTRNLAILLLGTILPIFLVYSAYYFGGGGNNLFSGLRFLLPTVPLWFLAGFFFLREIAVTRSLRAAVAVLLLLQAAIWVPSTLRRNREAGKGIERIAVARDFLKDRVPPGAALAADRRLQESLAWHPEWTLLDDSLLASVGTTGRGRFGRFGRPPRRSPPSPPRPGAEVPPGAPPPPVPPRAGDPYPRFRRASPMQREKGAKLRARYNVPDVELRAVRIVEDLYDLADRKEGIYWLTSRPEALDRVEDYLIPGDRFVEIGKIRLPRDLEAEARRRRRGMFGRGFGRMGGRGLGNFFSIPAGQRLTLFKLVRAGLDEEKTK